MPEEKKLYLKGGPMQIDMGDHLQEFNSGDELVDVSPGTLDSMVRLGQAVTKDKLQDEPIVAEASVDTTLQNRSVAELGLSEHIAGALVEAGLTTVGQVLHYAAEHGNLTDIPGIGEASEKAIEKAIKDAKK